MKKGKITGVLVPNIVPFKKSGEIDQEKLRQFVNWLIEKGIDAIFPLGSFGAGPLMEVSERKKCAELIVEAVDGRIPIICQINAQNTVLSVELAKHAEQIGIDAVASLPPGYYNYSADNIKRYFEDLLKNIEIPVYLYNNPGTVGYNIEPGLLAELVEMGISGVKDSSFDVIYLQKAMNAVKNKDFNWINGTAPLMLPSLVLGADACVLGTANAFPELAVALRDAIQNKQYEQAADLQKKTVKLVEIMNMETYIISVQKMLQLRGLNFAGYPRAPLQPFLNEKKSAQLKERLIKLELL